MLIDGYDKYLLVNKNIIMENKSIDKYINNSFLFFITFMKKLFKIFLYFN